MSATVGELRRPRNLHLSAEGSIHDDATAQRLGFRGGTIAGSYHMEQAVPAVLAQLGEGWFVNGSMSAYFSRATVHDEPVRVLTGEPAVADDTRSIALWMETENGDRVWDGSASIGHGSGGDLADRISSRDADQVRILADLEIGEVIDLGEQVLDGTRQRDRYAAGVMTEPLTWYADESPWGGPIASCSTEVWFTFESVKQVLVARRSGGVGLYGAIEIVHHAGPLMLDDAYDVSSTVRAIGCTPKTEYVWTETVASRAGKPIVSVLMMSRVMKASSDLYA